jgi:hypothetical protein
MESTFASGVFHVLCYDKDGNLKWEEKNRNLVMNTGVQYMAGVALTGTTQILNAGWYIGLIPNTAATTTIAAGDTMASHVGWGEFIAYSQATRVSPSFTAATLGSGSSVVTNASPAVFSVNTGFVTNSTGSSISGTTLTIGTLASGAVSAGQIITGTGVTAGTYIVSGSGSSWVVSPSQTVPATTISSTTASIAGAFLTSGSAKAGTTGTLFSASDFTTGDRTVVSGDTLNITYTFTLTATP